MGAAKGKCPRLCNDSCATPLPTNHPWLPSATTERGQTTWPTFEASSVRPDVCPPGPPPLPRLALPPPLHTQPSLRAPSEPPLHSYVSQIPPPEGWVPPVPKVPLLTCPPGQQLQSQNAGTLGCNSSSLAASCVTLSLPPGPCPQSGNNNSTSLTVLF